MIQAGLTGNIGSGKTLVCRLFEMLGVPVYYADEHARRITNTPDVRETIRKEFGDEVFDVEGNLDRKKLGSIVFEDKKALKSLNKIIHPRVRDDYKAWLQRQQGHPYTIQEAAILFETGHYRSFDRIIVVSAPRETRIQRVCRRDGLGRQDVERRMENQLEQSELEDRADHVILNDDRRLVIPQVLRLHELLYAEMQNSSGAKE
jgi:dephospho-CoA kinase